MAMHDLLREMELSIRSRYGLIWLETLEEERAESLSQHLAASMSLPLFIWNVTRGLQRADLEKPLYGTTDATRALDHIAYTSFPAIYYFQGFRAFLEDPLLATKLTAVARKFNGNNGALVLTGNSTEIPEAAKPYVALLRLPPPTRDDYKLLLQQIYRDLSKRMSIQVAMNQEDLNRLLNNLQGLTLMEAEKILTKAIIEDRRLSPEDIQEVIQAKKTIIEREGLLEYYPLEASMKDIADLAGLKAWLAKRKSIITTPEQAAKFGLNFPKGILLLGIPGTGKSLCAKAVAMEWGLPLLKMDPSNLYNKYIGESEKNFKRAMTTAEKMAPVVLWIDEIEKTFSTSGDEDSGVSKRVLGNFLSWMQERKGDVFVVATANDVERLPPELLRKGRFDEIFFVDLPNFEARAAVFGIHIRQRGHDEKQFDLELLAKASDGFSGAEIEQIIVSALYTAFSSNKPLTNHLLLEEASKTQPLSKMRAEHIEALREWAKERTVSAH